MNKLLPFIMLFALVTVGVFSNLLVPRLLDSQQPTLEKEVWVYAGHPVSQTIVPENNGLSMIRIYMRNVALRNQDPLEFTLADTTTGQILRKINLTGFNIGDREVIRFQFDPVPDSSGKKYTFTFSSPTKEIGQGLGIGYTSEDLYPPGTAITYESRPGDLTFQLYYQPTNRGLAVMKVFSNFLQSLFTIRVVTTLMGAFLFTVLTLGLINPSRLFSPRRTPGDR